MFWAAIFMLIWSLLLVSTLADESADTLSKCKSLCLQYEQQPSLSHHTACIASKSKEHRAYWDKSGCARLLTQACEPLQDLLPLRELRAPDRFDWTSTCNAAFGSLSNDTNADFVFLTVASKPIALYGNLLASLIEADIKVVTIGYNAFQSTVFAKDTKRYYKYFSGYKVVSVYYLLENCLSRGLVDKDTIVMFADGTDTLFQGSKQRVLSDFLSFNASIVWSTERDMWPDTHLTKTMYAKRPESGNRSLFRHLNSGGWMARVGPMLKWYEDWSNPPFVAYNKVSTKGNAKLPDAAKATAARKKKFVLTVADPQPPRQFKNATQLWNMRNAASETDLPLVFKVSDQFNAAHMFLYGVGDAVIDTSAKLIVSMWIPKKEQQDFFAYKGNGSSLHVVSKKTNTVPAILHYNGPARNNWCGHENIGISNESRLNAIFSTKNVEKNTAFLDENLNLLPQGLVSTELLKACVPRHAIKCETSCTRSKI